MIDTINNALIKQDESENEEIKKVINDERHSPHQAYNGHKRTNNAELRPEVAPDKARQWLSSSQHSPFYHSVETPKERHDTTSPTQCITSGLSKTRKRTFTGESKGSR